MINRMLLLIAIIMAILPKISLADCDYLYAKVGAGYKFDEPRHMKVNGLDVKLNHVSPYSARIEIGVECGNWTFGAAHHSQWLDGAPFNNREEPYKSEFFIDYTAKWEL